MNNNAKPQTTTAAMDAQERYFNDRQFFDLVNFLEMAMGRFTALELKQAMELAYIRHKNHI